MTSACPGVTLPMRLTNLSGGPDWPPGRRRLITGAPAVPFPQGSSPKACVMSTLRLEDLKQYSDTLRTRQGEALNVRFVEPRDTDELQHYFRSLTTRSRYNRFFGAISELPKGLLHDFLQVGERERFTVVATMMVDGFESIVAEARYAFHEQSATLEFGLSVDDLWQAHGIATALLKNVEARAPAL